jgi:hypothetical protein
MIILDGCDTFHLNVDGTRPGANAVKNAKVSGGFTDLIYYPSPNNAFINTYFTQLCAGDNAATANGKASMSVGSNQILLLQGTKSYKLT